jgi:hypothetical protein
MVIRTIREIKTTVVSEIPTVTVDSEIKTTAIRITRITAVSEIPEAAGQNLLVVDSEIAQAAKAPVQADSRAAEAALDKTIINKETNS